MTIATATGIVWLALMLHFGGGLAGLVSGFTAVVAPKGGRTHRLAGLIFVVSMMIGGLAGAGIAIYERKMGSIMGGTFTAYLVFTAYTTVRPIAGPHRQRWNVALMLAAFALAVVGFAAAFIALGLPKAAREGVPIQMSFFIPTIVLLAAIGDARVLRAGGIHGARRLARHLWRMCFGLFIASGSFFLGQMKFIPATLRIMPLIMTLAVGPLVFLLYWMWRVRLRQQLQGMVLRHPVRAGDPG